MSRGWSYTSGQHNAICDSCGRKFKSAELRKRWDGLMVCEDDWEPRHTLDFVRSRADRQTPPWIRPQLPIKFNHILGVFDATSLNDSFQKVTQFTREPIDIATISESRVTAITNGDISETTVVSEVRNTNLTKPISELVGITEYGIVSISPYIDPTYFLEDYIGSTITF